MARAEFLKTINFFKDNWASLRYRLETKNMVQPQIDQFEWCGDQINEKLNNAKIVGFKFDIKLEKSLREIANELRNLGTDIRKTSITVVSDEIIKHFIQIGEKILENLNEILEEAEKSVKIKWYRYFMPF